MKSGTSLFNKTISLNLLKRCWPVWTCWLAVLIFALPLNIYSGLSHSPYWDMWHAPVDIWVEQTVLNSACFFAKASFVVSIVAVMAMFSFLYNSRTCNMMCSLPVKRETLFVTAWVTGIAPLLAADIITALITMAAFPGTVSPVLAFRWLGIVTMGNIGFYGFGSFCAMLTGSLFILPLVYGVLGLTAAIVETSMVCILSALIFGAVFNGGKLLIFSPLIYMANNLHAGVRSHNDDFGMIFYEKVELFGTGYLFCFFIAGLIFSVLALLLFRKRRMETASDTVAIPVLKPIFKYCMAFGCAVVLPVVIYQIFLQGVLRGTALAVVISLLMIAGAFIGYFSAKMLISKSLRVFSGDWKGFAIVVAACLAFVIAAECDFTGYEKRLPDLSEVESVEFSMRSYAPLKEKQNIEAVYELQSSIIGNKKHHESSDKAMYLNLSYIMNDGSVIRRSYRITDPTVENFNADSDVIRANDIENSIEACLWRCTPAVPVTAENIYDAAIYNEPRYDKYGNYSEDDLRHSEIPMQIVLSPEQAEALYNECIIPDIKAGRMTDPWIEDMKGEDPYSGVSVSIQLISVPTDGQTDYYDHMTHDGVYLSLPETATLTLARLAELAASH